MFGPRGTAARLCRCFATVARVRVAARGLDVIVPARVPHRSCLVGVCRRGCGARRRLIELLCALVFLLLVFFSHCCCLLLLMLLLLWICSSNTGTALLERTRVIKVWCAVETLVDDVDNQADKGDRNREHPNVARGSGLYTARNRQNSETQIDVCV